MGWLKINLNLVNLIEVIFWLKIFKDFILGYVEIFKVFFCGECVECLFVFVNC